MVLVAGLRWADATQPLFRRSLLEAEEVLDLVPGADDEGDGDREQHRHRDVEAIPGEPGLLALPDTGLPLGAVIPVAELHRRRFDRRILYPVGGSGHEPEL